MLPEPDTTAEMAAAEPCIRSAQLYGRDDLPVERAHLEAAIIAGQRRYAAAVLDEAYARFCAIRANRDDYRLTQGEVWGTLDDLSDELEAVESTPSGVEGAGEGQRP